MVSGRGSITNNSREEGYIDTLHGEVKDPLDMMRKGFDEELSDVGINYQLWLVTVVDGQLILLIKTNQCMVGIRYYVT